MSTKTRRRFDAALKAKVALEALPHQARVAELAAKYEVHPNQVYAWRRQLITGAPGMFGSPSADTGQDAKVAEQHAEIARLRVVQDHFIAEVRSMSRPQRRAMIDHSHADLSMLRQCALLGLARSGVYRRPSEPNPQQLQLMRLLDEQCQATPSFGSRRMTAAHREIGYRVNRKRVQRLIRMRLPLG
jgi:transposase-like protein